MRSRTLHDGNIKTTIWSSWYVAALLLIVCSFNPTSCLSSELSDARDLFYAGKYDECETIARTQVDLGIWNEYWPRLLIECLLTRGKYTEALEVYEQAAERFTTSLTLRMLGAECLRYCQLNTEAKSLLNDIPELVQSSPWRFSDRDNMLAIGSYLLSQGEDPRAVLDAFYDRALKSDPQFVDAHLAIADLAISKADYEEAGKSLRLAEKLRPKDPHIKLLLAKTWAPSNPQQATKELQAALELNPSHVPSLLFQAENLIDSESYAEAEAVIESAFLVNPHAPRAWALKAAIAHLKGDYTNEGEYRREALKHWNLNPEVSYVIGSILSQHYRFEESIKYQRRALQFDPEYRPAQFQLAQDLLRVGAVDEGWELVDAVAEADKYNVVAFNLKTLKNRLQEFTTLEAPGLIVRMNAREADIYGTRVLRLLTEARDTLTRKYEVELPQNINVEIFPQQSDFAIRTFGLPGGAGYLGVCFGNLITVNSPASQSESPANWESVLWHEFCHVVTLNKTSNRMPRWLSEGLSVYEEVERDSRWGQQMSPAYQSMLLGEDFVPLSELSRAFMSPKSGQHLEFAYFESSLAVRYLIESQGLPLLLRLLDDLRAGMPVAEAFALRYGDATKLDEDFRRYVIQVTDDYCPGTDFDPTILPSRPTQAELGELIVNHPENYYVQRAVMESLVASQSWELADEAAQKLEKLCPNDVSAGGALETRVKIASQLSAVNREIEYLKKIADLSSDNLPVLRRLLDVSKANHDWDSVYLYASQFLAVQPLVAAGHENLVASAKELGHPEQAIDSLAALQQLSPVDPSGLHFEMASSLMKAGRIQEAKRQVLMALELSPRFREAQQLLIELTAAKREKPFDLAFPDPGTPPTPTIQISPSEALE